MIKRPFVEIAWEDAWSDPTEAISATDVHVKHKPALYKTYGFLLYEDDAGVSLTNEECVDDADFRGRNFINRSLIRSIVQFKLVKPRSTKPVGPQPDAAD